MGLNAPEKVYLLKIIQVEDSAEFALSRGKTRDTWPSIRIWGSRNHLSTRFWRKRPIIQMHPPVANEGQSGAELDSMFQEYNGLSEFELANGYAYQSEVTGVLLRLR